MSRQAETGSAREETLSLRERVSWILFAATGLALPFFAFPPIRLWGKPVDLATILAGAFVLSSVPSLRALAALRRTQLFLAAVLLVPLLALVPPRPPFFSPRQFALTYAHWLLVTGFFLCSLTLAPAEKNVRALLRANVVLAVLIAAFAFYQSFGWPRHWLGTQWVLVPFQREPFRFALIGGYLRPTSVFLEPSWLAGYLAWIIGLALVLIAAKEKRRRSVWLALAVLAGALVATLSWGGYADLLAVVSGFVLALSPSRKVFRNWVARASAAAIVLLALLLLSSPGHRILGIASARLQLLRETLAERNDAPTGMADSAWVRYRGLQRSAQLLLQHPIGGIGLGQYELAVGAAPGREEFAHFWCGWVASGSEMGILGPALLFAALLLGFHRLRRYPAGSRRAGSAACLAFAVVAQLHTGSFADLWWWFPVALAAVISASPSFSESAAVAGVSS